MVAAICVLKQVVGSFLVGVLIALAAMGLAFVLAIIAHALIDMAIAGWNL